MPHKNPLIFHQFQTSFFLLTKVSVPKPVRAKPNQPATVSVKIENKKGLPPTRASQTKPARHCFQWRKTLLPLPAMPPLNPDEGIFAQSQPVCHTCIYTKLTLESLFSFHCSPPAATPAFHI
jgi:hypothetical protein